MYQKALIVFLLVASTILVLLNFIYPLDLAFGYLPIDPPPKGEIGWADNRSLRTIAAAHLGVFVTLFALAPAVISIVAERSNEKIQVPIFRRVIFEAVKPLNSSLLAAVGIVSSLGSVLLPSVILTIMQSLILIVLIALITRQLRNAVRIQFEPSSKLARRIIAYVAEELEEAMKQEKMADKEISEFRKIVISTLSASTLYVPRNNHDAYRYAVTVDIPEGERVVKLYGRSLVKEIRMLTSKIDHCIDDNDLAESAGRACRVYLPSEHGYLRHGFKPPLLFVDVPSGHDEKKVQEWISATSVRVADKVGFEVDQRAYLFEKFEETFRKLYEAIAGNSLSTLEMHLRVFKGIFPPLRLDKLNDDV